VEGGEGVVGHEEGADHVAVARGAEIAGRALATETANLGLATTRELLEELRVRGEVASTVQGGERGPQGALLYAMVNVTLRQLGKETLDYRTVDDK
jgi:hypothetical protein